MSSMTPFFSITASSSFFTSSKVKPYWKPEQPPPVTNTRSLSSELPSSSISCLTLLAALSLNISGDGISAEVSGETLSVTAFIANAPWLAAGSELKLYALRLGTAVDQPAFDHRALLNLDALVVHIAFDPGASLEFESLRGVHRPVDCSVHDNVRRLYLAVDARVGRHHQSARLF